MHAAVATESADEDAETHPVRSNGAAAESNREKTISLRAAGFLAATVGAFSALLAAVITAGAQSGVQLGPRTNWQAGAIQEREIVNEGAIQEPTGENIFAELTAEEIQTVARHVAQTLKCDTKYVDLTRCFVSGAEGISLLVPPKADVLAYLDAGAPAPARVARVIVTHGDKSPEKGVGLYNVGPLDGHGGLAAEVKVQLVRSLHWNYRPYQMDDASMDAPIQKALEPIRELLVDTFGPVFPTFPDKFKPDEAGRVVFWSGANVFSTLKRRSSRIWLNWVKDLNEFQVSWLHTLPFSFDVAQEGPPEDWKIENVSYCGQSFHCVDTLKLADDAGKLWRCDGRQHTENTWDVPGPDPGTPAASAKPAQPPVVKKTWQATPGGTVRWGDWQFVATLRPASGLALHNVQWRGERILYELSLSDAHAYYAGPNPGKQYHFSDKASSMVQISGDMVEGLDCPKGATFLTGAIWTKSYMNSKIVTDPSLAIPVKLACVYESDGSSGSSWRHTQLYNRRTTGRSKKFLVVRAIGTVGNYDYISEVLFGEDGSVHVREEFAGYPEVDRAFHHLKPRNGATETRSLQSSDVDWGTVVTAEEDGKGDLVQNLHAHFAAWKVDLDVLGLENEFHITEVAMGEPSFQGPAQKIQRTHRVDQEDPSLTLVSNAQTPKLWRIVNPKKLNSRSNVPRGYGIVIGSAPAVLPYQTPHPFATSGNFARRHMAVSVRHDDEPAATSVFDFYSVTEPLYSVDKFLSNRESLVGKDLVCWVSVGKEHVARLEDQPLVSNFGVHFSILPWNYHEENAEMQLPMHGPGPAELLERKR